MKPKDKPLMDNKKKKILESKGYTVGPVDKFLGLSKEESEYIKKDSHKGTKAPRL